MAVPRTLDFCFDYLSPYAYFAWLRVGELCAARGVALRPRPVLLAGLLERWGQLGPAEIPPKRQFVVRDALRIAARRGVPLRPPSPHPFNPLLALRLSLPEVSGDRQRDVVSALYSACWGRGENVSDEAAVARALGAIDIEPAPLIERTRDPEIKAALRRSTEDAITEGVFGVPTMIVDGQLFWGDDQMQSIGDVLDGKDPIDARALDALTAAAPGQHRPRKA
jgi:2-hydroxychromene-2-carboxylate isomerase